MSLKPASSDCTLESRCCQHYVGPASVPYSVCHLCSSSPASLEIVMCPWPRRTRGMCWPSQMKQRATISAASSQIAPKDTGTASGDMSCEPWPVSDTYVPVHQESRPGVERAARADWRVLWRPAWPPLEDPLPVTVVGVCRGSCPGSTGTWDACRHLASVAYLSRRVGGQVGIMAGTRVGT